MSVVNDVLKNLNQRHAQENMARHIPHLYEAKPAPQYMLWVLLVLILSTSVVIAISQWQQPNYAVQSIELPSDLFLLDESSIGINEYAITPTLEKAFEKDLKLPPVKTHTADNLPSQEVAINILPEKISNRPIATNGPQNTRVSKSHQSQAVDKVVAALKSGDHKAAEVGLDKTPKAMQDEVKLRLMVKESPEKVLPYINNNFVNYSQNPSLLAMAAQAQQRIQQHFSAISIYKQLIKVQPKDARWRAGIAISLEASGELNAAKHMYQLALSMPGLPRPLGAFCQKRLSALN